jgi:hypothetical protein
LDAVQEPELPTLTIDQLKKIDSIVDQQVRERFPIKPFKSKKERQLENLESQTWDS